MLLWLFIFGIIIYLIYNSKVVVYYYKPTCPYCVEFDPVWEELKKRHPKLWMFKIKGSSSVERVPTVRYYNGFKSVDYTGPRDIESLCEFTSKFEA